MILKVHHLRPAAGEKTKRTRVGRGEASKGKTAGRGTKGTKARYQVRLGFEGGQMPLIMRIPKLKGFKNPAKVYYMPIDLNKLKSLFPEGGDIKEQDFLSKKILSKPYTSIKIVNGGEIDKAYNLTGIKVTSTAKEKIESQGGSVK